jgi:hypothetical protein
MKTQAMACLLAFTLLGTGRSFASDPGSIVVDTVLVRPVCLAGTIIGSALFLVSLPVALTSKSVHRSANALVATPAYATFRRPLGDIDWNDHERTKDNQKKDSPKTEPTPGE